MKHKTNKFFFREIVRFQENQKLEIFQLFQEKKKEDENLL